MKAMPSMVIGTLLAGILSSEGADYAGWTVGFSADGYGTILRTSDSGATWTRQGYGQLADASFNGVVAVDPLTAWVVGNASDGYGTIYHTTDGGLTWAREGSAAQLPSASLLKVATYGFNDIWAVGDSAILHSSDSGATWTNQIPAAYTGVNMQGIYTLDGVTVWATGTASGGYATILKSTDGGLSWTRQSGGDVSQATHLLGIAAFNTNTAWTLGGNDFGGYVVLNTKDGGTTWLRQSAITGNQDGNEISIVGNSTIWLACDGAVYWSFDGGTNWSNKSIGPFTLGVSAVSTGDVWAVVGGVHGEIWHTSDSGASWQEQGIAGTTLPSLSTVSFAITPVPEPSSVALLTLGLATLAGGCRRRLSCRQRTSPQLEKISDGQEHRCRPKFTGGWMS